ncbi:unnamed protein product [marine sediment metagenome]|uniref:HTH cro/C1-type domain-containing protein n=1 Tax=marine sediment metagenome TaxID=412755 RepID=X1NI18_9ZZZZ
MEKQGVSQWLEDRCHREHLSLRQAAARTGLSHATVGDIIRGGHPSPQTITKLAQAFSDGTNQRLALEDRLLVLAGYRTPHPERVSEALAQVIDKVREFSEPQLTMMVSFANFLKSLEGGQ